VRGYVLLAGYWQQKPARRAKRSERNFQMRSWRILLAAFAVPAVATATAIVAPSAAQAISYSQITNANSGKCLDVYNWSKQPGATIDQWSCGNRQKNQEWGPRAVGSLVEIINENSGLCLISDAVAGDGVTQAACTGNAGELWLDQSTSSGDVFRNDETGYALEVYGASKSNGAIVDTWYYNGKNNQLWSIVGF
jgi:hypothetical protein